MEYDTARAAFYHSEPESEFGAPPLIPRQNLVHPPPKSRSEFGAHPPPYRLPVYAPLRV